MPTDLFLFYLFIGIIFGFLAGLIAFAITYNEWREHKYAGARLWKESLTVGIFAFGIFLSLALLLGFILNALNI
jgi:hypothetical protein